MADKQTGRKKKERYRQTETDTQTDRQTVGGQTDRQ